MERHGVRDEEKMLEELTGNVFVDGVVLGELEGDVEHRERVEAHPPGTVGLAHRAARRELLGAVERRDVVEAEEAALEDVLARRVLPVDPPIREHESGKENYNGIRIAAEKRCTR